MNAAQWWPTVRAIFVAFHLLAITISALPSPEGGMNRAQWRDPTVKSEFAAWAARLQMDPSEFEERVWTFAVAWQKAYNLLLTPVRPYEDLTGADQSWKMFVAPHKFPTSMELSVRPADGEWRVIYSEQDATKDWRKGMLGVERIRSAVFRWGWNAYAVSWTRGCTALARLALEDYPDAGEVRCRFWKAKSPSPDEAQSGIKAPGRWVNIRMVRRGPEPLKAEKLPDEPEPERVPG